MATSQTITGEFAKNGRMIVITNGKDITTTILDVIECSNSSTFETILEANLGNKHKTQEGTSAWILLDLTEGVDKGSLTQE